ncbi:hypothetical protein D0T08_14905 [Emticicia sp. C21]|nr:hypothetical protein D0T08_14905 [Emticicia sp. C21]
MCSCKSIYLSIFILLFITYNGYSQNIRNTIIKDLTTNNRDGVLHDFIDFNGKTYLLIGDLVQEVPGKFDYKSKYQFAVIDTLTRQWSIIKEDTTRFSLFSAKGKFYPSESNYFYFTEQIHNITHVWLSSGTSAGTRKLLSTDYGFMGFAGETFYFYKKVQDNSDDFNIYKLTKDSNGLVLVATIPILQVQTFYAGKEKIYFFSWAYLNGNYGPAIGYFHSIDANGTLVTFHSSPWSGNFGFIGEVNNKLVFHADSTFSTNGTAGSSTLIAPRRLIDCCMQEGYKVKDKLYFIGDARLWKTDGTSANTAIVDNNYGAQLLRLNMGDEYFYTGGIYSGNIQLWKTNGGVNTKIRDSLAVKSFAVSPDSSFAYFGDDKGQLWKYQKGTTTSNRINTDFLKITKLKFIGKDLLILGELKNSTIGAQLYFYKNNLLTLYRTINPNTKASGISNLKLVDKHLFCVVNGDLIVTQGEAENTISIPDIKYINSSSDYMRKNDSVFTVFNAQEIGEINLRSRTYTTKAPYLTNSYYDKIFRVNQHVLLMYDKDIVEYNQNTNTSSVIKNFDNGIYYPDKSILFNNELYFFRNSADNLELWKTDGTSNGTILLKDFGNSLSQETKNLGSYIVNNTLIMYLIIAGESYLWKTNGTPAGTESVVKIPDAYKRAITMVSDGKNLYFTLIDIIDRFGYLSLYRTNNSLTGIELLQTVRELDQAEAFCSCANAIYFFTTYPNLFWKYDIASNTLTTLETFANINFFKNPICLNNTLWIPMAEWDEAQRDFIYVSDLNTGQSKRIKHALLRIGSDFERADMFVLNNSIIYKSTDPKYGGELFWAGLCESNNQRNSVSVTGSYYHTGAVSSTEKINQPTAVNLFSPKNIILQPGFEAKNGANFYAAIKQCE